jgi:hypothetical protein
LSLGSCREIGAKTSNLNVRPVLPLDDDATLGLALFTDEAWKDL